MSHDAITLLKNYSWPGNVRELRNCMERVVLQCMENTIHVDTLPTEILEVVHLDETEETIEDQKSPLVEQEKKMIIDALEKCHWNQSQAARVLRISRDTLRYRLKKYNIHV